MIKEILSGEPNADPTRRRSFIDMIRRSPSGENSSGESNKDPKTTQRFLSVPGTSTQGATVPMITVDEEEDIYEQEEEGDEALKRA